MKNKQFFPSEDDHLGIETHDESIIKIFWYLGITVLFYFTLIKTINWG